MSLDSAKAPVQDQFNRCAQFYLENSPMADRELLKLIVRLSAPKPEDQALDVACGAGFLVCELAKSVRKAIGVDLSSAMLSEAENHARALRLANTLFRLGDGEALPYPDGTFDIVTCKLAFHYFPNPGRAVGEMKRVAKKGARMVLVDRVSSTDQQKQEYHNRIEKLRTPSKTKVYSTSEIVDVLETRGLSVDHIQLYEQHQDFEEWIQTTGAPEENRRRARELMLQSIRDDLTGLKARFEGDRLMMTHGTAILVAKKGVI